MYTCTVYIQTETHTHAHTTVGNRIPSALVWWGKVRPSCNQKKQRATIKAVLKQSVAWGMDPCVGMRKRKRTLSCVHRIESSATGQRRSGWLCNRNDIVLCRGEISFLSSLCPLLLSPLLFCLPSWRRRSLWVSWATSISRMDGGDATAALRQKKEGRGVLAFQKNPQKHKSGINLPSHKHTF